MGRSLGQSLLAGLILLVLVFALFELDSRTNRVAGTALTFVAAIVYALLALRSGSRNASGRRYPWLVLAALMLFVGMARLASS